MLRIHRTKLSQSKFSRMSWLGLAGTVSCCALVLVFGLMLFPSLPQETYAAPEAPAIPPSTGTSVGINLPASIDFDSVTPTPDGATTTATANLTVTTTNSASYSLYLYSSDGDNSLRPKISANTSSIIATAGGVGLTLSSLEPNTWGYSLGTVTPDDSTTYVGVPTDSSTAIQTKDTSTTNSANDTYTLSFGAKVDATIPSGTYAGTLTVAVVAEPGGIPITYNANGGYFNDDPSQTTETVAYMIEEVSNEVEIAKTSNISDDGTDTGSGYGDNVSDTQTVTIPGAQSLKVTVTYQTESTNYDWLAIYDSSVTPSQSNYADSITGKLGGTTKVDNAVFTIPGDTAQFYFRSDSSSSNYYGYYATVQANPTITPNIELETPTRPGYTFLGWYKDAAGTAGQEFVLDGSLQAGTVYAKWLKDLTIVFNGNGNTGGSMANQTITYGDNILNINTYTKSDDYVFTGWNTEANGSGTTYEDGATYSYTASIGSDTLTLYAQWGQNLLDDVTYMQDLTASHCSGSYDGATAILTDRRDNNTYTVKKIKNICIMVQNLRLASGTRLTSTYSNVASSYTMPTAQLAGNEILFNVGQMQMSSTTNYGGYYNFCAASAGTVCNENAVDSTYDICPKGWHLPSEEEVSFFEDGTYAEMDSLYRAFGPTWSGGYYNSFSQPGALSSGSCWYWLSSSGSRGDQQVFSTVSYSGTGYSGMRISDYGRDSGYHVRCVLAQ